MRNVLIIGVGTVDALGRALSDDGFQVTVRAPGEIDHDELRGFNVVISQLVEDHATRELVAGAGSAERPPVIALLDAAGLAEFELQSGADDFFVEGSDPRELIARVRQVLWNRHQVDAENVISYGHLVIDLSNYTVHVSGQPVDFTYKEFELLRFLATNPDRVFGRDELLNKVWGYDFYGGARTVDVHVRRLRAKIETKHDTFIETVRNVGYRFRAKPWRTEP
jgi:DNA-binding response OmpR family regulator